MHRRGIDSVLALHHVLDAIELSRLTASVGFIDVRFLVENIGLLQWQYNVECFV